MKLKGRFLTDRGKVRDHNEDAGGIYYNQPGQFLAVIADGMGGHKAGDVASQMAVDQVQAKWENEDKWLTQDEIENWLSETVRNMNKALFDHAQTHEACHGMGTTIVITICTEEFVTVAHVGDSRCYIYDDNGLLQVTEDHSLVNALVQAGQISKEEAIDHPRKNVVLKACGTEEHVEPDVKGFTWKTTDQLLLCSDGLTDKLTDEQLESLIGKKESLIETGQQMVNQANESGGEDNISLILIQHDDSEEGDTSC